MAVPSGGGEVPPYPSMCRNGRKRLMALRLDRSSGATL
jgi:hypothetical protein